MERPRTVLIADDEPDILEIAGFCLGRIAGWRVLVAASGEEAVEVACADLPDVVLLDLTMPGGGGLAAIERLRERESTSRVPVILMTARGERETRDLAGLAGVIFKPFDPLTLAERIDGILAGGT